MAYTPIDLTPYVKVKSIRRRFLALVAFCDHGRKCNQCCWLWEGDKTKEGYGLLYVCLLSHKPPYKKLMAIASRFMFTLENGHTTEQVLHSCDKPSCLNYHHLFSGTQRENVRDMINKGRDNYLKGEKHGQSKLTPDIISHMKILRKSGLTYKAIGSIVGVSGSHARSVLLGQHWKHLSSLP